MSKTVRLVKPHTHGGLQLKPGAILSLNDRTADWLIEQNIAVQHGATILSAPAPVKTAKRIRTGCCGWR
jgi:hypothetical protein